MPAYAWARDSAGGPILDFTNPANARKIYDYLPRPRGRPAPTPATRCGRSSTGLTRSTSFNNTTGGFTMAAEPQLRGPALGQGADPARRSRTPRTRRSSTRCWRTGIDIGYMPQTDVPQLSAVERAGYTCSATPTGLHLPELQLRGQDRRLQPHHQPALHPAGVRSPGGRGGLHQGLLPRGRGPGLRPGPGRPGVAVHAGQRAEEPVPSASARGQPAQVARLARGCPAVPTPARSRAPGRASAAPGSRPAPSSNSRDYNQRPGHHRRDADQLGVGSQKVGIAVDLKSDTFNQVINIAERPGSPKTINDWAMGINGGDTNYTYPTMFGIFSAGGSLNGDSGMTPRPTS